MTRVHAQLALILAFAAGVTATATQMPDEGSPESWAFGARETYTQYCSACHGEWGEGASAASLVDDEWKYGSTNEAIAETIRKGRPGTAMIGFGEILEEEQIQQLVALIRMAASFSAYRHRPAIVDPDGDVVESEEQTFHIEVVVRDLWVPWALEFRPDGSMLVSDRQGQLWVVEDGKRRDEPVAGTPTPWTVQDGGFLDIALHPDYGKNEWVYLAYAEPGPDNTSASERGPKNTSMTKLVRGRIRDNRWVDEEVLFQAPPELYDAKSMHYGSRLLFDRDGTLLYSIGDRGEKARAQDLSSPLGKVHRTNGDGTVPSDNPFVGREDALPTVWTFGHRNIQGFALDPRTDLLWASEHGPIGGDELNIIEPGHNYGWPVVSTGMEPGLEGTEKEGMDSPVRYWNPSIAPSAILFYEGDRYPAWKNDLFMATLGGRALRRFEVSGREVTHEEKVLDGYGRVRDVRTGPDGLLYVALERREGMEMTRPLGLVVRLVPEAE